MELGRPAAGGHIAFIDRGRRELPGAPDFIGRTVPTIAGEEVRGCLTEIDGEDGVWLVEPQSKDEDGA